VVTIGTFDGVHLGHKKILDKITQSAAELNCQSLVLTFFPHPRTVLQEGIVMKQLNTLDEKIELLQKSNIDNLIIHPFNKEFSRLTAEEFVEKVLVEKFHVKKIVIGYDHRFGKDRTANIEDLISFGKKYGFDVEQISVKEIEEVSISSTKIRNALSEGNIELVNNYLGYQYHFTGVVTKGQQLGRTIGYPTANIVLLEEYKLLPQNGVYVVQSVIGGKIVYGMMNIGTRPTVEGKSLTIEVHYFNFDADLYNQQLTITVLKRIRSEQKFESFEVLKSQLASDKETSLSFISEL
jgi:riboflavin kinase/FMN adenylyltransferase